MLRPDGQSITLAYGAATGLLDQMTIPSGVYGYSYDPDTAQLTGIVAPGNAGLSYVRTRTIRYHSGHTLLKRNFRPPRASPAQRLKSIRGNSDEEIQIWNECARLVTNAIIYFNSKVLSHLLDSFEYQSKAELLEMIKRSSPVAWENINFRGTYTFAGADKMPKLEDLMATIEGYMPIFEK